MKRLEITNGRARLYFDGINHIRMDYNGAGPAMELTREDRVKLVAALLASLDSRESAISSKTRLTTSPPST